MRALPHLPILLGLALCQATSAQTPATQTPAPSGPIVLTLQEALQRARQYAQQVYTANIAALLAHEDAVQAKAALLPTVNGLSQFIYTQPNYGSPSGVFVSNDGPHVYNDQALVHGEIFNLAKRADYHKAIATEAVARAKADLASRGLIATVVQNYYGMVVAQRKIANARQSLDEAKTLLDITQKQEQGGEVSHYDVVKAQIQLEQRQRDVQEAQLALDKVRFGFAVLLFPNFGQEYSVTDDLATAPPLPPFAEIQTRAGNNSPDIRAAQATVQQQTFAIRSARAAFLPTLSFDYFFGINANQFAIHNPEGLNLLGSVAQAQLTIPIWTWGATRSKVKQAELQLQLAKNDLSFTQRQILAELNQFYQEAQIASSQVASLQHSMELSRDGLRLTLLRYQAGEATILEIADAQSTLVQARNAYDDGLVRYRLALASLQTLTGAF
ncbi:MAG TPA: TolC family protein [Bryobacteraceae bacterium]|jgi:outer membrane protein TolC|nr:TolC family protein [Bryobacteraceae bacterium]